MAFIAHHRGVEHAFRMDGNAVLMPEVRLGREMAHKIAGRLAAGGGDLAERVEIRAEFRLQQFTARAHVVAGNFIGRFHDLRRAGDVDDCARGLSALVKREQQFDAAVFTRFKADEIRASRVAVHLRHACGEGGTTAMADAGDAEAMGDAARLEALPRLADGVADRLDQERVVFFRRQTVWIKGAPFAEERLGVRVRRVVRVDCAQEDVFRA